MAWKQFNPPTAPRGVTVPGDPSAPPTKWYNHWLLALAGWKTIAAFQVETDKSFHVGFRNFKGEQYLCDKLLNSQPWQPPKAADTTPSTGYRLPKIDPGFRVKVGHEACTFFAVDQDGNELPIRHIVSDTGSPLTEDNTYNGPLL